MLYDVIVAIFEGYIYYSTFTRLFKKKYPMWLYVLFFLVSTLLLCGLRYLKVAPLVFSAYFIVMAVVLSCLYVGNIQKKISLTMLISSINIVSEIACGYFYFLSLGREISVDDPIYPIFAMISKLIFMLSMRLICRWKLRQNMPYGSPYTVYLEIIPCISIPSVVILGVISQNFNKFENMLIFFSVCGILLINIIVFVLFDVITKQNASMIKFKLENDGLKWNIEKYQSLLDQSREVASFTHDLSNHFRVIFGFAEKGQLSDIKTYCRDLNFSGDEFLEEKIFPRLPGIDSVLRQKFKFAKENGIKIQHFISVPGTLPIKIVDLCVIIGNMLDNALQACMDIEDEKFINMEMYCSHNKLVLKISNSSKEVFDQEKEKDEAVSLHGHGLSNIKKTVQKYGGNMITEYKDGVFSNKMFLMLNVGVSD